MIYARIVDPESAYYPTLEEYFDEETANQIVLDGGRDFGNHNGDLLKYAKSLCSDIEYEYVTQYDDIVAKKHNGEYFSEGDFAKLKEITEEKKSWGEIENDFIIEFLSIHFGTAYKQCTIRGSVHREWAIIYIPNEWDRNMVQEIEDIYFCQGNEVAISESTIPEEPEDIGEYYSFYNLQYEDDIKKRIAQDYNVGVDEVTLYRVKTYVRTPVYEIVQ